jgi:ATP-dependent HslUV protease ATP-binding subunit HslU
MENSSSNQTSLDTMTPREIVSELDKYVVGQADAKRAVAVAMRNRTRRRKLPAEIARDVLPKNILMIGSTGVGKTEIARRLARLSGSPFIKVEASKYTEVGYMGRDVESMVRELVDSAVDMVKQRMQKDVIPFAEANVEERILDILFPMPTTYFNPSDPDSASLAAERDAANQRTRDKLREQLRNGELSERVIEFDTSDRSNPMLDFVGGGDMGDMGVNLKDMFGTMFPTKTVRKRLKVSEATAVLLRDELDSLIDMEQVTRTAVELAEQSGMIFLDEIDKIAGRESGGSGPDVSRQGVQRDLLPIVEGTTVNTRYGMVNTDHILFVAAGAFHITKPSDLIPELQGRFPIRVELESLSQDDLRRILVEPKNSLMKQYQALLATEGINLEFDDDAISELAHMAETINEKAEDIGARRLHTLLEKLLEEISFLGSELEEKTQKIDRNYVLTKLTPYIEDEELRETAL